MNRSSSVMVPRSVSQDQPRSSRSSPFLIPSHLFLLPLPMQEGHRNVPMASSLEGRTPNLVAFPHH